MAQQLTLSDGTLSRNFFTGQIRALKDGFNLPTPGRENTYAESADSEGRRRVRHRPLNVEGDFTVLVFEDNATDFRDLCDELQELVEAVNRSKTATLVYEATDDHDAVTFDLVSCTLSAFTQARGTSIASFNQEATVSFECRPYGRLAPVLLTLAS